MPSGPGILGLGSGGGPRRQTEHTCQPSNPCGGPGSSARALLPLPARRGPARRVCTCVRSPPRPASYVAQAGPPAPGSQLRRGRRPSRPSPLRHLPQLSCPGSATSSTRTLCPSSGRADWLQVRDRVCTPPALRGSRQSHNQMLKTSVPTDPRAASR